MFSLRTVVRRCAPTPLLLRCRVNNSAWIYGGPPLTQKRYNAAVTLRRTPLVALAVLVAAFVALYPYSGAMEMCDFGECPYAAQSPSHTSSAGVATCLTAVLAASGVARLASAMLRGRRLLTEDRSPAQLYLSPDPPPPRTSLGL